MATKLDLADAQIIGFSHAQKNSNDIIGLIQSMGLTKEEWLKWKNYYPSPLSISEINKIDKYFKL